MSTSDRLRIPTPPQWVLWVLVVIALVCAISKSRAQEVPLVPVMAIYDEGQLSQARDIAAARHARALPPLHAILNPDSGPSSAAVRKPFLTWQPPSTRKDKAGKPIPTVVNIGYVDLEDDDSVLKSVATLRNELAAWRSAGVLMILLDDSHPWDLQKTANTYRDTVWNALKGSGYQTKDVILNAGGPVTKASAWMKSKDYSYIVCDFEDPTKRLLSNCTGPMWLGFVSGREDAQTLINVARQRKVRFIGFDNLDAWKVEGQEWQTRLKPDLVSLLITLQP